MVRSNGWRYSRRDRHHANSAMKCTAANAWPRIRSGDGVANTISSSRPRKRAIASGGAMGVWLLGAVVGPHTWGQGQSTPADSAWDVVVLGRIDFCLVCQREPPPNLRYTQVLAGQLSRAQATGQLALTAMDTRLLPEGGAPIYKS